MHKLQVLFMVLFISISLIFSETKIRKNISQYFLNLKKHSLANSKSVIEANFESECKEVLLKSSNTLEAKCSNKRVSIDLSKCIANFHGKLVYIKNGNFGETCNKCNIKKTNKSNKSSSYFLECSCQDTNRRQIISKINLVDFLFVKSGKLHCDDVANLVSPPEVINPSIIDTNCDKVSLVSNNRFQAICTNAKSAKSANRVAVNFNLDKCITNSNGQLVLKDNGFYSGSCRNCRIEERNRVYFLLCYCADITNSFKYVEAPLNKFISFRGNSIRCASVEKENININIEPASKLTFDIISDKKVLEKLTLNKNLSASDNFMILCRNLKIENNNILKAYCGNKNAEYSLNLNSCFSNIDGTIKINKNGNYGKSCRNCAIKFDNEDKYVLACTCEKADRRSWNDTYISLKERVVYNESKNALECLTNVVLPEDNSNKICIKN